MASCAVVRTLLALTLLLALAPVAHAARPPASWPPAGGPGTLLAHYGEEHWNDPDGKAILSQVVADVARYAPALVTMSGDKANNGTPGELEPWLEIMGAYDRVGIPWLAGVGNHDRDLGLGEDAAAELGGVSPAGDLSHYERVFAGRPYPMGDAAPYDAPGFAPRERDPGDAEGAASHFYVDVPGVRIVYIDNSCQSITNCDLLQNPPDAGGLPQYEYLRARAREAKEQGRLVFVVMHQPTRDPGDQLYRKDTAKFHVMAKGATPDNVLFEQVAAEAEVDAVFVAHIKGQFEYRGTGGIPYFIDGGAGGALYTTGPVGTDHGYWHGYRLIRVHDGKWESQAVPVFVAGSLRVEGPGELARGSRATFAGFGRQPVANHTAKVEALELRDPAPTPRPGPALPAAVVWLSPALLALLLAAGLVRPGARLRRSGAVLAGAAVLGGGSLAMAQQSEPTSTPVESLPNPARIWTSADPAVLAPVASESEDPARNPRRQTADGTFEARCPGRTKIWLTSGWETVAHPVTVPSAPGRIAKRVRIGRERARVVLAQPAVVRVRAGKRLVRNACLPAGRHTVRLPRGAKRVRVAVRSDREPLVRHRERR